MQTFYISGKNHLMDQVRERERTRKRDRKLAGMDNLFACLLVLTELLKQNYSVYILKLSTSIPPSPSPGMSLILY